MDMLDMNAISSSYILCQNIQVNNALVLRNVIAILSWVYMLACVYCTFPIIQVSRGDMLSGALTFVSMARSSLRNTVHPLGLGRKAPPLVQLIGAGTRESDFGRSDGACKLHAPL